MRKLIILIIALNFVLFTLPANSSAQVGDAWQLIAEVNALRSANGLPPYEVNNALMSAAQGQSDYQASIGTWTHTGPGDSRPYDRAVAAGYGGGARVFVSENVATGIDLSTSRTVNEMWQDAIHLETMVSRLYTHIGAGVAHADGWVYYTIVVGYIAGSAGSGASTVPTSLPVGTETGITPLPTVVPVEPIGIATPAADGSIQHEVQPGQFLENIANAYEVELSDLLDLNGFVPQTVIFPGDKLLIQAGSTPAPDTVRRGSPTTDQDPTNIPTAAPTETPMVNTPTLAAAVMSTSSRPSPTAPVAAKSGDSDSGQSGNVDFLLYAVFGLALAGTGIILLGSALKRHAG